MGAEPGQCSPGGRRYHGFSGPVAQLVEQGTFNPKVAGSIPARPTLQNPQNAAFVAPTNPGPGNARKISDPSVTRGTSLAEWRATGRTQPQLGHDKPRFTLDTYVHLLDEDVPEPTFFDLIARGDQSVTRERRNEPNWASSGDEENFSISKQNAS
jgi:hypothetical protein